jgi:hypothetical protein
MRGRCPIRVKVQVVPLQDDNAPWSSCWGRRSSGIGHMGSYWWCNDGYIENDKEEETNRWTASRIGRPAAADAAITTTSSSMLMGRREGRKSSSIGFLLGNIGHRRRRRRWGRQQRDRRQHDRRPALYWQWPLLLDESGNSPPFVAYLVDAIVVGIVVWAHMGGRQSRRPELVRHPNCHGR